MKNKVKIIMSLFAIIIMYFILFLVIKYTSFISFSYDLLFICSFVIFFIALHLVIDINKIYEFIYKYRYLIGIILLSYITILGYNGSSIAFWNRIIQPDTDNYDVVLGIARGIRSDEWLVNTPNALSQVYNEFSNVNNTLMGISSNVTLYPSLPAFDISIICNIFNLPFLILPFENAFALMWFGKLFLIFFAWFELFMIITKKKKVYSLLGTVLVTFSAANMWWYCNNLAILAYGPLAILIIYKFINSNKVVYKLVLSVLLAIVGLNYIFVLYPAWQVSYGYVFFCFVIWILIENKAKIRWSDLLYLILVLLIIIIIAMIVFSNSVDIYNTVTSTVYPGKRFSTGGYGYNLLFNYFASIFFPVISYHNPSEMSNFLSFYPVPIIMSLYLIFIKKNKDLYLILFTICGILLSLWNYIELPNIIAKISLISFSIPERANIVVGFICVLLLIRILSIYENKESLILKKINISIILSGFIVITTIYICYQILNNYLNTWMIVITFIIFIPLISLIIFNNTKTNKYLAVILIILSLYMGGTVNPINKGLDVLTKKPFAKEIQKIVNEDTNKKWVVVNSHFAVPNYLVANGAKTINSVNYYPNLELWHKLDQNGDYDYIYNRYAHITITLTKNDSSFVLTENDKFNVNLNIDDIMLLDADYIVSQEDISTYENALVKFELLYEEDGMYIYKIES